MLSITHVIPGLDAAGAEHMLLKVIQRRSSGVVHGVISLTSSGSLGSKLGDAGAKVRSLGWQRGRIPGLSAMADLRRAVGGWRSDVVQGWMYHGNLMATLAGLGRGWPVAWSVRCTLAKQLESRLTGAVIDVGAFCSRAPATIIYNSERARREHEAAGYRARMSVVIPNGFDTDAFAPDGEARARFRARLGVDSDTLLVGHLARLHAVKDHPTFLDAAARVARVVPNSRFVAAGTNVPLLAHAGMCSENVRALGGRLVLLDALDDVRGYLNALDVFVLSSRSEGFPNVLGEAMACGLPCVTTDAGDCAEIAVDPGFVVEKENSQAMAEAIVRMARLDKHTRAALGAQARSRIVERYSLDEIAAQYEAVWCSMAGRTRREVDRLSLSVPGE